MKHQIELQIEAGKALTLETGHLAKEADGAVVIRVGDTMLLAAATASSQPREGIDFFPLMVDFEEKLYAIGRIPGGFFKREGRPPETAILNSRKVDRPIRPLFPEGFRNDVQVIVSTLSFDNENHYDILGIIDASAALSISDIPFDGPIGAARVELVKKVGKKKKTVALHVIDEKIRAFVLKSYKCKIESALKIADKDKQSAELAVIENNIKEELLANAALKDIFAANPKDIKKIIEDIEYDFVRDMVLNEGKRIDGRGLDEIREIGVEIGVVPRAHGSAVFSRGQTQVLTIATLGSAGEEQTLEGLDIEETGKRYMHHYNFPAYSVGEVKPLRGPGRREIGHGALAEKALIPVLPTKESFPYTIRLVSEVLGSNGSTSMASTCASTLALMDAGVKISSPVAGISVGLITSGPPPPLRRG